MLGVALLGLLAWLVFSFDAYKAYLAYWPIGLAYCLSGSLAYGCIGLLLADYAYLHCYLT